MVDRPRTPARSAPERRPVPEQQSEGPGLGFERVVFFSDAVFAIVITLLVLPLTAEIDLPEGDGGVGSKVLDLGPSVLTFVVSFLVVGQFWLAHHRTFGHLHRIDHPLMWLNLVTLLTVAFMPFPAALLGAHSSPDDVFPVVFYAASMTVASAAFTGTWLYALARGLTDPASSRAEDRRITRRALATTAVFAVSIAVGFLGLLPAVVFWLGVLPAARLLAGRRSGTGRAVS